MSSFQFYVIALNFLTVSRSKMGARILAYLQNYSSLYAVFFNHYPFTWVHKHDIKTSQQLSKTAFHLVCL